MPIWIIPSPPNVVLHLVLGDGPLPLILESILCMN
jgi:hypothetical protein